MLLFYDLNVLVSTFSKYLLVIFLLQKKNEDKQEKSGSSVSDDRNALHSGSASSSSSSSSFSPDEVCKEQIDFFVLVSFRVAPVLCLTGNFFQVEDFPYSEEDASSEKELMDGRTCEPGLYKVKNSKQSGFSRRKKKLTTEVGLSLLFLCYKMLPFLLLVAMQIAIFVHVIYGMILVFLLLMNRFYVRNKDMTNKLFNLFNLFNLKTSNVSFSLLFLLFFPYGS